MALYDSVLKPLLFRLDPEKAHRLGMAFLRRGWVRGLAFEDPRLEQELFGISFKNPLGLAAGFDKDAEALGHWHRLGFGFVEVGTVTRHAQPGNPQPRLFRLPKDKALINRLGFNNHGSEAMAAAVRASSPRIPFGINLGKSKVTPLEEAPQDYAHSYSLLHGFGSYFVVNVSSPNTPGLRSLQDKGPLLEILAALREVDPGRPLFVKVAPDLERDALDDVVEVAHTAQIQGLIATNTTLRREGLTSSIDEQGGLSGAPLKQLSNQVLAYLASSLSPSITLIGVGGILNGEDLYDKIALGAHLCQVYTGFVYGGPRMPGLALKQLLERLYAEGMTSVAQLRGTALQPA